MTLSSATRNPTRKTMIQQLIVTIANVPANTPAFVDIGGNGKDLIPVIGCEVIDGQLVIHASKAKAHVTPDVTATADTAKPKRRTKKAEAEPVADTSADDLDIE
jgi:hydroxymethylglutaryl-CoA reductase